MRDILRTSGILLSFLLIFLNSLFAQQEDGDLGIYEKLDQYLPSDLIFTDIGTEYDVFTISFDPTEKPKLAKDKKKTFSKLVKNKDVEHGWTYFTGDYENIEKLLNSIGYKVQKTGAEYIHPAAILVLSPEGKITRYLHGTYFLPFDLKMAVVEASEGRSGPTINKVLRFCFSYDPEGKKYVFNITKISGAVILLFAALLFFGLILKNKKKKTTKEG